MIDRPIRLSLYAPPHSERSSPVQVASSVRELLADLTGAPVQVAEKSDAPAWSPIIYSGPHRRASDAVSVCALVYDLDAPERVNWPDLEVRLDSLRWVYAIHETFTAGRARLCVPLSRDLDPREYARVWQWGAESLGLWESIDRACGDLARLFYAPACPVGEARGEGQAGGEVLAEPPGFMIPAAKVREPVQATPPPSELPGKFFDLGKLREEILDSSSAHRAALLELLDGTLRIPSGMRENLLHPVASALAFMRHCPPEGVARELFRRVLSARDGADTHLDEWTEKAMHSYARGAERKQVKDAGDAVVEKFFRDEEWREKLKFITDSKGGVKGLKPLEANVIAVLRNDDAWRGHVRWNVLRQKIEVTGGVLDSLHSNARESLDIPSAAWFQTSAYNCDVGRDTVGACLQHVALENPFDPVREYLDNLPRWDGVPRIDEALNRYAMAGGDPGWNRIISRKFFISAIARPLRPGCQVDTVLVLQGYQGGGKTSFVRTLGAGFHVETSLDLHSKDAVMTAVSNWLVELGELASLRKSDIESVRNFITRKEDQIRLPYGRNIKVMPRRCVFVGTTNSRQPLTDPEGNRRFWVVSVGAIDIEALEKDREQLWAEAKEAFLSGEPWWLSPEEAARAAREASVYEADDVLRGELLTWLLNLKDESWPEYLSSSIVAQKVLGKPATTLTPLEVTGINRTLAKFGWNRQRRRVRGAPSWVYVVPERKKVEEALARESGMDKVTTESEAA